MASDTAGTVGSGLSNGSLGMVGTTIYQVARPTCDTFVNYMLQRWGLDVDVLASTIMRDMGLTEVSGTGLGPYNGRINKSERHKGSPYRIVLGRAEGSYRLITIT